MQIKQTRHIATDLEKVQQIAQVAGISIQHITPLGQGATSAAWHIATLHEVFIVRYMPTGTLRPVTYQSEFTILRMLRQAECPVPDPVISSVELTAPIPGIPEAWAITRVIPGQAIQQQPLSPTVAQALGRLLATLHTLPVQGLGRLVEQPHILTGQQQDAVDSVCARWCWADLWPFDGSELALHPFALSKSHLQEKIEALDAAIFASVIAQPMSLNHSDLHGEHIFVHGGVLSGIIDFGAAFIGTPAWDFAVLAFYHGWSAAQSTLSSYQSPVQQQFLRHIQLLALVVGLYKLARAVKAQAPIPKIVRIEEFLAQTLKEL